MSVAEPETEPRPTEFPVWFLDYKTGAFSGKGEIKGKYIRDPPGPEVLQ